MRILGILHQTLDALGLRGGFVKVNCFSAGRLALRILRPGASERHAPAMGCKRQSSFQVLTNPSGSGWQRHNSPVSAWILMNEVGRFSKVMDSFRVGSPPTRNLLRSIASPW
jgi:hypothetical protein